MLSAFPKIRLSRVVIFVAIIVISAFIVQPVAAENTGEYPESVGARCSDVPYGTVETATSKLDREGADGFYILGPNPNGPTIVDLGLYVEEITSVDENTNSYTMQGFMDLVWCDPRQSYDAAEAGVPVKIFLEDDAHELLKKAWWPNLDFVNAHKATQFENEELFIHPDGTMDLRFKFLADLSTRFDLKSFPFDSQKLQVEIESFTWASDALLFHLEEDVVGFGEEFNAPEWKVVGVHEEIVSRKEIRDRSEFSEFLAEIEVSRDPGVYLTKVMIPLAVIILLSMLVFWLDSENFEGRLGIAMTGLLTAVAYQFIASSKLPMHVYDTYLDFFVNWSFIAIIFVIGQSAHVAWLHHIGKDDLAKILNRLARWLVPLSYLGFAFILYMVFSA